ncbi:MAG: hypothetical protein Q8R13_03600 [bacterium]|nr:hypothetical protein [bacterium]
MPLPIRIISRYRSFFGATPAGCRIISRYRSFVGRSAPSSAGKGCRFSGFFSATLAGCRVLSRSPLAPSFVGATLTRSRCSGFARQNLIGFVGPAGWRVINNTQFNVKLRVE